ncbi:hypothetical protein Syun_016560 [Stephania yunnanensis]|uniref:AB hydrolase-1 domain-containing protein n=1 Tax=Stephania yunnanensis TaxID=152371 RepID=A0AAP0P2B3_9MAGN
MFVSIAVVVVVGLLGWAYKAAVPPRPKICGSPNGPPVTSPRVTLSDGRHLAYKEMGVSKDKAKYKIIVVHGVDSSKDVYLPVSQELVEELGIYLLMFDRAGYAESDPNPNRSVKSDALDIEELADKLEIGSKFYLLGFSAGGCPAWGCLNYIPHRLSGLSLVVPLVNYWWPSLPADLRRFAFKRMFLRDQCVYRLAHYAPQLLYWWLTQKWFPSFTPLEGHPSIFSSQDLEILKKMEGAPVPDQKKTRQQGVYESLHRDIMVGFGDWGFDPLVMSNPFPNGESSVHIWQGNDDRMIPVLLQRHVAERLPWITYTEVPNAGHFLVHDNVYIDAILRELLLGERPSFA